jgi:hypothetical protein
MEVQNEAFRIPKACSTGGVFNCVAVAITSEGVAVRDTKDPTKTTLGFTNSEWTAFIGAVKAGEFDVKS